MGDVKNGAGTALTPGAVRCCTRGGASSVLPRGRHPVWLVSATEKRLSTGGHPVGRGGDRRTRVLCGAYGTSIEVSPLSRSPSSNACRQAIETVYFWLKTV